MQGMLLVLWLGCGSDEPVITAVPTPISAEELTIQRYKQLEKASPVNLVRTYEKPAGIYVDVRYFGGKNYESVRDQLTEQLGAVQDTNELGDLGREVVFERGTLRVQGGEIYMIEIPLPEPLRRTEALGVLGFPPASRDYLSLTLEYRLTNVWGFRRIRFLRAERDSEDIVRVQAWKRER